ncbi:MAG: DUF368 domain-containing protein [Clostridia bacterium]|nr:DUF368 domain-containing protein [Clostridia bacterium]
MKKWLLDVLRGMVIGVANIIPGVSGGTMMVSMGIYDTLIYCITHLFKQLKKSLLTLLPYGVGIVAALAGLSFIITGCMDRFPLPTACMFIGLILGGVPAIWKEMKHEKKGAVGMVLLILSFALIVGMQLMKTENVAVIELSLLEVMKLLLFGCIASATMVIPGVSGSMILMILGYYRPVIDAIKGTMTALQALDFAGVFANVGILLPFGAGVVVGIFAIAKLIEWLLHKAKGPTYCVIMGLVISSPVVVLMEAFANGAVLTFGTVVCSVVTLGAGYAVAYIMSRLDEKVEKSKA